MAPRSLSQSSRNVTSLCHPKHDDHLYNLSSSDLKFNDSEDLDRSNGCQTESAQITQPIDNGGRDSFEIHETFSNKPFKTTDSVPEHKPPTPLKPSLSKKSKIPNYCVFGPKKTVRIVDKFEFHNTPHHSKKENGDEKSTKEADVDRYENVRRDVQLMAAALHEKDRNINEENDDHGAAYDIDEKTDEENASTNETSQCEEKGGSAEDNEEPTSMGIEFLKNRESCCELMAKRLAHINAVLDEQERQDELEICDAEAIAFVSLQYSRWARERAVILGDMHASQAVE